MCVNLSVHGMGRRESVKAPRMGRIRRSLFPAEKPIIRLLISAGKPSGWSMGYASARGRTRWALAPGCGKKHEGVSGPDGDRCFDGQAGEERLPEEHRQRGRGVHKTAFGRILPAAYDGMPACLRSFVNAEGRECPSRRAFGDTHRAPPSRGASSVSAQAM